MLQLCPKWYGMGQLRLLAFLAALSPSTSDVEMGPLRGEYGFLTEFDGITEVEARERVRKMVAVFGILEFQFYNAFEGYSKPPALGLDKWHCAAMHTPVRRSIVWAYTDEIMRLGGRSWLYVQTMGTDPGDVDTQHGFQVTGHYEVGGKPLLDIIVANSRWAEAIAPKWASFASSLGFSGIHWDTLGQGNIASGHQCDLPGFLRAALPLLREKGLAQTCNFINGFGWEKSLLESAGGSQNTVAFPYWDAGPVPEEEAHFFDFLSYWDSGTVLVEFPMRMETSVGAWSLDVILQRWQKVRCHSGSYLCIGDGSKRIHSDYLGDAVKMNDSEVEKIREFLAAENTCLGGSGGSPQTASDLLGDPTQMRDQTPTAPQPPPCIHSTVARQGQLLLSLVSSTDSGSNAAATIKAHKMAVARVVADTLGFCSLRILDVDCQGACSVARSSADSNSENVIKLTLPLEAKGERASSDTAQSPHALPSSLQRAFDAAGLRLTVKGAMVSLTHLPNELVPARFSLMLAAAFCALAVPLGFNSLARGKRGRETANVQVEKQDGDATFKTPNKQLGH